MSLHYDLYPSGNPTKKNKPATLYPRVASSGTLAAEKFIEQVSLASGFNRSTLNGCLQAVTDELQRWLADGWTVEVGDLGHFSISLKADHPVTAKKDIRSPSIRFRRINLQMNRNYRRRFDGMDIRRTEHPAPPSTAVDKERCRALLVEHLEAKGCIYRHDFMRLTGTNKDKAIDLLNEFAAEGLIRRYGGGRTVVYLGAR